MILRYMIAMLRTLVRASFSLQSRSRNSNLKNTISDGFFHQHWNPYCGCWLVYTAVRRDMDLNADWVVLFFVVCCFGAPAFWCCFLVRGGVLGVVEYHEKSIFMEES